MGTEVSNTLSLFHSFMKLLKKIEKDNQNRLKAEEKFGRESLESIQSLRDYAALETPELAATFSSMVDSLESVEKARIEKIKSLRENFISPIHQILEEEKRIEEQLRNSSKTEKQHNKIVKNYNKFINLPEEKKSEDAMQSIEVELEKWNNQYREEKRNVAELRKNHFKRKIAMLQDMIHSWVSEEEGFYKGAIQKIDPIDNLAEGINVQKEIQEYERRLSHL